VTNPRALAAAVAAPIATALLSLPFDVIADLPAWPERLLPILLVLVLAPAPALLTRPRMTAMLAFTLEVAILVDPGARPSHLACAGLLLLLVVRGGEDRALDRGLIGRRPAKPEPLAAARRARRLTNL
jgi:hypothetical protein